MIRQIADVVRVRKRDREGRCQVRLPSARSLITVPIVADVDAGSHPTRSAGFRFRDAEQYRLHAEIELRVGLLAVDYIERVRRVRLHAGDLEVEPLMPGTAVHVRRQDEIVLSRAYLRTGTKSGGKRKRITR